MIEKVKWVGRKTQKPERLLRLFAVRTGLEPATPCVTGTYSNQLNYRTFKFFATLSRIADANV